jgi:hypothetical protein
MGLSASTGGGGLAPEATTAHFRAVVLQAAVVDHPELDLVEKIDQPGEVIQAQAEHVRPVVRRDDQRVHASGSDELDANGRWKSKKGANSGASCSFFAART